MLVVTGGTAFAAAKLIDGRTLRNGSVAGAKLTNNSVTGAKLKTGTVEAADLSDKARAALTGQQGPRGETGSVGAQGVKGDTGMPGAPGADGALAGHTVASLKPTACPSGYLALPSAQPLLCVSYTSAGSLSFAAALEACADVHARLMTVSDAILITHIVERDQIPTPGGGVKNWTYDGTVNTPSHFWSADAVDATNAKVVNGGSPLLGGADNLTFTSTPMATATPTYCVTAPHAPIEDA